MLCEHCKKNQVTKTYERVVGGKTVIDYYCLSCYHRLFDTAETDAVCPYCGTTESEVKRRSIVGCAKCYQSLQRAVVSKIDKMQGGDTTHTGKGPDGGDHERIARRCHELKKCIEMLNAEKSFDRAKQYASALLRLQRGEEEVFVWEKTSTIRKK